MRFFKPLNPIALALVATLALAGCKSAEERAEEHYQNGMELIASEDYDRAIVEFRNVFRFDGSHLEARRELADLLLNHRGNRQAAYSQYLRLVEQYPNDLDARLILAELAFGAGNWEEVERHGAKAGELDPENPRVAAINVIRDYRNAILAEDPSARREQARIAEKELEAQPNNIILRNVLMDNHLREDDLPAALNDIDWLVENHPDNPRYWRQRQDILARLGDLDALEEQLRDMVVRFPDEESHKQTLLRFYLAREDLDAAEGFLRGLAEQNSSEPGPRVDLIRFLGEIRGVAAARAEIEAAIAEAEDPTLFRVLGAGLDFESGNSKQAIATLEDILAAAEPSEQTRDVKVTLARMLLATGNEVGARARIEEVLTEEPTEPNALKMRAAWQIEADEADAAVASLRTALDETPEDPQAMTLMAQAHTRAGRPELARDFLALAVEASGNAPDETIRYARLLIREERFLPAEDILLPALRLQPKNIDLLAMLGQLYLNMEDYGRAEQVSSALRQVGTEVALRAADGIDAERINRQSGPQEALTFLEDLANSADATLASRISLVRARIATGDVEGALQLARELNAENPDSEPLQAVLAATEVANGNFEEAENLYSSLLESNPERPGVWLEMSRLKLRQGDSKGARETVEKALVLIPNNMGLMWAQASYLEQDGDIDGAIAIYEELYERNSGVMVVANNLASLLATYRPDPDSLDRAWNIARRFKETELPAMQDTYGWIAHRRGDSAEALPYLEAAANGLPEDPVVQYHLGQVYLALDKLEPAMEQFRKSASVAGPADQREQIVTARRLVGDLRERIAAEKAQQQEEGGTDN